MDMCGLKGQMVLDLQMLAGWQGCIMSEHHPMGGREKSGYYASIPNLFDGANFIIYPNLWHKQRSSGTVSALAKEIGFGNWF